MSCTSLSSRQVTTPRPSEVSCIRSLTSNSGSPKNRSAPWDSSSTIFRSSTPTVAPDIPPYCASAGLPSSEERYWSTARRSDRSSSGSWPSSQYLNTIVSTLVWVSLSESVLPRSSGPNELTVARSWTPSFPERLTNSRRAGLPVPPDVLARR